MIYELKLDTEDMTSYHLPKADQRQRFLELVAQTQDRHLSIADQWQPFTLAVEEQQDTDPDFFDIYDSGALILSLEAAAFVSVFFVGREDEFELLPFDNQKQFFLFNIIEPTDCLHQESECDFREDGMILKEEYEYAYIDEELAGDAIFVMKGMPDKIFITHVFEFYYDQKELKGLELE